MQASRPAPTPGLNLAGATPGQVLTFDGQVFSPSNPTGGDDAQVIDSPDFPLELPAGATKAAWAFTVIGTRTGGGGNNAPVYVQEGFINAWKVAGMDDIDGELVLHHSSRPDWADEPEVHGSGDTMTVSFGPGDAAWHTTLRLLGSTS